MTKNSVVVLGAGESGAGAAILAKTRGIPVFVSDKGMIKTEYRNVLSQYEIDFEEGKHSFSKLLKADEVVKSPGIPDKIPLLGAFREKGTPIISEIEFASRFCDAFKICITGSNGKTTTTLLTWHILKNAGLNVGLAGNVGKSFALQVALEKHDYYVLEISSFQLDGMFSFKADIAVLLNITPDHLDRYDMDFSKYAGSKFRIIQNQTSADAFVYCADDPAINSGIKHRTIAARRFPFTTTTVLKADGAYLDDQEMVIQTNANSLRMTIEQLALQGRHNVYNSMAAGISSQLIGLRKETIRQRLSDFQQVEHRLEHVANVHGIEFINDSKATNINSTWWALETVAKPVIWIAGGVDKGNDYSALTHLVKTKVKAIICLGIDNSNIYKAFADLVPTVFETRSAAEAVNMAYLLGEKGDTVLLSPACASFDLFENFEDRGNQFKQAVNQL
ncbi:MAG TPA: UDP-N-acetylmuramoyl-L-alanine--D-glutamate ligase [Bacteroidales bacterium]|nr:UDP-N-acetylmuramoyl-L-alanine--D-glutamate ligase [Bacteroidales bacterium]